MNINFNKHGLIPAIVQEDSTKEVLMLAYMNQESFDKTVETGKAHYYSRSRKKLWLKGETSGHFQIVKDIRYDCDEDTILLIVEQIGGACHTGHHSCFYRSLKEEKELSEREFNPEEVYDREDMLKEVYNVIQDRRNNPKENSYTNYLFDKGIDKMLKKIGEESAEVIIASKNPDKGEIIYEIADLIYHLSVVMVQRNVTWDDIYNELKKRRQ